MVAFARPSLSEILTRIAGDIAARTVGHAYIRRMVERTLGFAVGGVAHHLHGHVEWVRKQLFPHTADADGLQTWGDWLGTPRTAGARAAGRVQITGAGSLPVGTIAQNGAGDTYRIGTHAGSGVYLIEAVETGARQNLSVGETVYLTSPIAAVSSTLAVSLAISGGADTEELELYRQRVIEALRKPIPYGKRGDYRRWMLMREGVTRAWEQDLRMGPGTVSMAFVYDGRSDIFPTADDLASMQAWIDSQRPQDLRRAYVTSPVQNAITLTVAAKGSMTQADMATQIRNFLKEDAQLEAPMSMSRLHEAISRTPGEISHAITALSIGTPSGFTVLDPQAVNITPGPWGLFTLGVLTLTVVP